MNRWEWREGKWFLCKHVAILLWTVYKQPREFQLLCVCSETLNNQNKKTK